MKIKKYSKDWLNQYSFIWFFNNQKIHQLIDKSAFKILDQIGDHRETFFGTPFEVINIPKPNNQAYTADQLANHTDLPIMNMFQDINFFIV